MEKFNKKEYDLNFRKEALKEKKKAQFNTDLDYNTKQDIDEFLKQNNLSKAEFIKKNYKLSVLKQKVKEIILKYRIRHEFPFPPNLNDGKKENFNNGIIVYSYTFPVLNDEKMLVLRVEFNDEIIYYGVVNYNRSLQILEEIEKLDTSF